MIRPSREEGGAVAVLTLAAGKGNVLDQRTIAGLREALRGAAADPRVAAILLEADGPAFSFGASVAEHRRDVVAGTLAALHALVLELVESPAPVIACVRGACLGGGLEVALACTRIVVAPGASLGQPEIRLGVFAPVGSILLPRRVGEGRAAPLLLTGATLGADDALAAGLADEVAEDPGLAARAWVRSGLLGLSASSVRLAHRALRRPAADALRAQLPVLERMYLDDLLATHDANEGIEAFLEKRPASWRHV